MSTGQLRRVVGVLAMLLASLLAVVIASPAGATTPVATLTGEHLETCVERATGTSILPCTTFQGTLVTTARCDASGGGRITWTATGLATGPYPGTFRETGVVEFASRTVVTRATAYFHIDSPTAQIDGRKFLAPTSTGSLTFCGQPFTEGGGRVLFGSEADLFGLRYEAIIKPATGGNYADVGTIPLLSVGSLALQQPLSGCGEVRATEGAIVENFASDLVAPQPLPNGCGDRQRSDGEYAAEMERLNELNRQRALHGLPALQLNPTLSAVARTHSCDREEHGDHGERGSDNSTALDRIALSGVPFSVAAENDGSGVGSLASAALTAIQLGLATDPLAATNALNPAFTQVGIGVVYEDGRMWLTEDFVDG